MQNTFLFSYSIIEKISLSGQVKNRAFRYKPYKFVEFVFFDDIIIKSGAKKHSFVVFDHDKEESPDCVGTT